MFDCIVLGTGGIGSAALLNAAKRGWKVLGLDQFGPAHNLGSSHGQTRMIRTAYFEHPNYVPLVQKAFEAWDQMQSETQVPMIRRTGLLQVGFEDGPVIQGVLKSAEDYHLQVERLSADKIGERFPLVKPDRDHLGVFESDAGFLHVEKCVASMIRFAKSAGAEYRGNAKVVGWEAKDEGGFIVATENDKYETRQLIVTAGAWSGQVLSDLGLPLRIVRKQQHWFQSDRVDGHVETGFPCFFIETKDRYWFYGVPAIDKLGMKIAEHTHGQEIESSDHLDREINVDDVNRVQAFVDQHFDFGRRRIIYHSACMYTLTPDEHFIVDRHPQHSGLVFAAGLSGHGFKFSPVLGKQLVDLLDGAGDDDMDFFKLSRFAE